MTMIMTVLIANNNHNFNTVDSGSDNNDNNALILHHLHL